MVCQKLHLPQLAKFYATEVPNMHVLPSDLKENTAVDIAQVNAPAAQIERASLISPPSQLHDSISDTSQVYFRNSPPPRPSQNLPPAEIGLIPGAGKSNVLGRKTKADYHRTGHCSKLKWERLRKLSRISQLGRGGCQLRVYPK